MSAVRRFALIVALAVPSTATLPRSLAAQLARGTVTDSASHQPIPGAVVTLLGADGAVLSQTITGERGGFGVSSNHGAKSIRVVRIGFQPRDIAFAGAADLTRPLDIAMVPFSTTLATVRVSAQSNCPVSDDRSAALAFWGQARAGLLNAVVARRAHPMSVHRLYFQTAFSAENDTVKRFVVFEDSSRSTETSFNSVRSARDLVLRGFAGDTNVVGYMFGPDADVLLDDAFANGYCFRLAASSSARPTQVGLDFAPAAFKRGRVDIAGTLWVDTAARALHDVEFSYVGMRDVAERLNPGGTISFATSANGVTFISRWSLRLLGNAPDTVFTLNRCHTTCRLINDHFYPTENGAEVSHAVWDDGRRWDATLGSVSIRLLAAGGRPAARTAVQLDGTQYQGTADSSGIVLIHDLLPGPYAVRVRDSRIAVLAFLLPTTGAFAAVRDSTVRVTLDVPTVEDFAAGQCRNARQWKSTDSTYVVGRVVDHDKRPVAGVEMTYALADDTSKKTWGNVAFTTGDDGIFQFCGADFTRGRTLTVRASRSGYPDVNFSHKIESSTTIVPVRVEVRP